MKRISILLSEEELQAFKRKVFDKNQNMSSLVRGWVKKYTSTGPSLQGGTQSIPSNAKPLSRTDDHEEHIKLYAESPEFKEQKQIDKLRNTAFNNYLNIKKEDIEGGPQLHRCESPFNCKSFQTKLIKGEGYDDEGTLKSFEKWLCDKHK